jgi:hypothetical protein
VEFEARCLAGFAKGDADALGRKLEQLGATRAGERERLRPVTEKLMNEEAPEALHQP